MPAWIYLVPAAVLFRLGTAPALLSTILYDVASLVRVTILGMTQVPADRVELGRAVGATDWTLCKIKTPPGVPTLMVGINQCILLSLAMVGLAGVVGGGVT